MRGAVVCGPAVAWDWLVLDVAYVMLLVGGSVILRTRVASTFTWVLFGVLSIGVGGFLLGATFHTEAVAAASAQNTTTVAMLTAAC